MLAKTQRVPTAFSLSDFLHSLDPKETLTIMRNWAAQYAKRE
jgi:hypothetical protein